VNKRAIAVNSVAMVQRKEVERTAERLAEVSKALEDIASAAKRCSAQAERTTDSTEQAMGAVQGALDGMHEMRESIQQTGKRIKRLGDRSQEITGIVDIIGTITERTHMLALNASMQAASAGEAGRGFGVVADEVQRLAESSRDATRQIGVLVRNIQIDTNDTIVTMDKTIGLVVDGTKLAESAGRQMALTRDTTADLVDTVRLVETESAEQSAMSSRLQEQSGAIVERTVETTVGMTAQLEQTKTLAQYSQVLNKVVKVFTLPNDTPPPGTAK
jgi:methyl-accepting chemotaxis protein